MSTNISNNVEKAKTQKKLSLKQKWMLPIKAKNIHLIQKAKNVRFIGKHTSTRHESAGVIMGFATDDASCSLECTACKVT